MQIVVFRIFVVYLLKSSWLCPTRMLHVICSPVEDFVQPSLGFHCKSVLHTDNLSCPYFDNAVVVGETVVVGKPNG